jgi:predicted Ser/Thr protein kinase
MVENSPAASPQESAAAQRVGTTIKGKWRIDALLGVGGMAAVYAGTHRNGQRAALKIMHLDLARDEGVVDRFLREAYVANKVGHPAIAKVVDDDVTEADEPFLVMELLEGETVKDLWRRTGRVAIKDALHIAERVLDCLAACHAAGIVHRDLKPANVFVTKRGDVRLLDFGVARERQVSAERGGAGLALGTPAYMSPEQAKGLVDKIDGRSDLFSVGALLHALITGRRIHRGRTEQESLKLAASQPVPPVAGLAPDLPPEVQRLIDKALAWEPRDRWADARAMQTATLRAMAVVDRMGDVVEGEALPYADDGDERTPVHEPVERLDPRVGEVERVGVLLQEAYAAVAARGVKDATAVSAIRALARQVQSVLDGRGTVQLGVRPYGLTAFGHVVVDADAPFNVALHRLFDSGGRTIRFLQGTNEQHLATFLGALADTPDTLDLGATLWTLLPDPIRVDTALVIAEGSLRERERFFEESVALELRLLQRTHAGRKQFPKEASPLAPEDVVRAVYASQLDLSRSFDRYGELVTAALLAAAREREVPAVLHALRRIGAELHGTGHEGDVQRLERSVAESLAQRLPAKDAPKLIGAVRSALYGKDALAALLHAGGRAGDAPPEALSKVLAELPASELPVLLSTLARPALPARLRDLLLPHVARLGGPDAEARARLTAETAANQPPLVAQRDAAAAEDARALVALAGAVRFAEARDVRSHAFEDALAFAAHELAGRTTPLEVLFVYGATFVGRRALFGMRDEEDAVLALGGLLARCGGAFLEVDPGATATDVRAFIEAVANSLAKDDGSFSAATQKIRLLPVSDVLRTRGVDVERLAAEPRAVRAFASTTIALRAWREAVLAKRYALPRSVLRAVNELAALLPSSPWLLASLLEPGSDPDEIAVATALLAGSMVSLLVDDRHRVADAILASLLVDVAVSRAGSGVPDAATLPLVGVERGVSSVLSAATVAHEALSLRAGRAPGTRAALLHSRIVHVARSYFEIVTDRSSVAVATPEHAVAQLAARYVEPADKLLLRLVVASLAFLPAGTVVKLGSGEVAEVIASNRAEGRGATARIVMDEHGEEYADPFEVELLPGDESMRVVKVINVDQWRRGPARVVSRPPAGSGFTGRAAPLDPEPPTVSPVGRSVEPEALPSTARVPTPVPAPPVVSSAPPAPRPSSAVAPLPRPVGVTPSASGVLGTTPLAHVLVYMLDHALTGTVEIVEPDQTAHHVRFVRGVPVNVRTGRVIAPLGAQLVAAGLIGDADAADAVTGSRAAGARLGEFLVRRELLARLDLLRQLELQVHRKLETLANVDPTSVYSFFRDVDFFPSEEQPMEIDPLRAVLGVARAWGDHDRIRKTLDRVAALVLQLHPESTLDLVELDPAERALLADLRSSPCTFGELAGRRQFPVEVVAAFVFGALVTRQFLVPNQPKPPMGVRPRPRMSPVPERISAVPRSPGPPDAVHRPSPSPDRASAVPVAPPSQRSASMPQPPPSQRSVPIPQPPPSQGSVPSPPVSERPARSASPLPQKRISWSQLTAPRKPSKPTMQATKKSPAAVTATKPPAVRPPLTARQQEALVALRPAEVALAAKDSKAALRHARKAQDVDATVPDVNALAIWAQVLEGSLKPMVAIAELASILVADPTCVRARVYRAKLLKRENKLSDAKAELERALEDDPAHREAQNELKLLMLTFRR